MLTYSCSNVLFKNMPIGGPTCSSGSQLSSLNGLQSLLHFEIQIKSPFYIYIGNRREQMFCHKIRINQLRSCCIFTSFIHSFILGDGIFVCFALQTWCILPTLVFICFLDLWPKLYQGKMQAPIYFFYIFSLSGIDMCLALPWSTLLVLPA